MLMGDQSFPCDAVDGNVFVVSPWVLQDFSWFWVYIFCLELQPVFGYFWKAFLFVITFTFKVIYDA